MDNDGNGKQAWSEKEKRWIDQQKIEFHEIDENGDGTLTRDELLVKTEFVLFLKFRLF
jgi:hypothetical protein